MSDIQPETEGHRLLHQFDTLLHNHKNTTKDEASKLRRDIEELIANGSGETKRTITELESRVEALTEYIEEQKRQQTEKDRLKDSESTIVIPPDDVVPPQPQATPEEQSFDGSEGEKKTSFWKKLW